MGFTNTLLAMSLATTATAFTHIRQAANLNLTTTTNQTVFADVIPYHTGTGVALATVSYKLTDTYNSTNFFSDFAFFDDIDPTHGFVDYVSYADAKSAGLASIKGSQVYMGVDYTTVNPASPGRKSVRVTSNKAFNHGLFLADIAHMPGSICGVWPAYWMFGPNWPASGEIDIIEGVNTQTTDVITLHTASGCSINIDGSQSGTTLTNANCNTDSGNTGCSVSTTLGQSYGDSFNLNGGGVYAMQWETSGVYVWFWPHDSVPADVTSGSPDTTNWGTPVVAFNGASTCDIDAYFQNMNLVFDTTFCGDWAGSAAAWFSSGCSALASTCTSYVQSYPGAFAPAYWLINTIKVYELS